MAEPDGGRTALDRMTRTMYFAIGIASLIFGALLAQGNGGFIGQFRQVATPLIVFSVLVSIVMPASFAVLGRFLRLSTMRLLVAFVAIGFVASQLLYPLAVHADKLAGGASPWLQGFGAIPATLMAVAWGGRIAWVYALAQGPIIVAVSLAVRDATMVQSVLEGLGAMVSCSIFAGVSIAIMLASKRLDIVAEQARKQASLEATSMTREREQSRINAMVHDDIMSVLLAASREPSTPGLAHQARVALRSVESLATAEIATRPYAPEELVAVLRQTTGEAGAEAHFTYAIDSHDSIPQDVVAAFAEALEEALRNSIRHAGDDANRSVTVTVAPEGVGLTVDDDGVGFSPRDIPQRRLGLRVSIYERMRSLDGGDARVRSKPGAGAHISLTWARA